MSGPNVKKKSARVSIGGGSNHKIKKLSGGIKLSSSNATLKSGGSGCVVRQFNGMDTDRKVSKGEEVPDSRMNMPQAKRFNNSVTVGSPFGSINYDMEEKEEVSLPSLDPKIIKTQVEVTMKKSFTLDINLLPIEKKSATAKTQIIRKLFSGINGFGRATTPSKFEGIIRSTFMSEESMERTASLARKKGIIVNNDLKRQGICSDRAIVIKKITIDIPKNMIITAQKAVVEFAKSEQAVQLASKWLFLIGKDLVRVTMAVGDRKTWASRDQFRALLFTLPVGTTAYDLGNLLKQADGKTCIINRSFETGNRVCCAVVGFDSEEKLEAAFCMEPIFGGVKLSWTRLDLVWCEKYGRFGHSVLKYDASDVFIPVPSIVLKKKRHFFSADHFYLAKLYVKKNVPISHPAAFGSKSWTQMVSLASSAGGSSSGSGFGFGPSLSGALGLVGGAPFSPINGSPLDARLASLEHSLKLLADQVSGILRKLNFVELVSMVPSSDTSSLVGSVPVAPVLNSDIVLDGMLMSPSPPSSNAELDAGFSSSSSKVLTTKVGGLESKMLALEASVGSVLNQCSCQAGECCMLASQFWQFGLVHHENKVEIEEISGQVILVCLLFKGKLSVIILGLYAGASLGIHFRQASEVNSFIAKAVNASNFVVLGGNFNKNESGRSASYGFYLGLSLVNSLIEKTIDYILVSENLSSAVAKHWVGSVSEFFDTDHKTVMVSVDLGGLLDVKDADASKWSEFRNCVSAKLLLIKDLFYDAKAGGDLDTIWAILGKVMVESTDEIFSRQWFSEFQCSRNKHSSKFFGLELLVVKIVGVVCTGDVLEVDRLVKKWSTLDEAKACAFSDLVRLDVSSMVLFKYLSLSHKEYRKSKMFESRLAEEAFIRRAVKKHIESFASNKRGIIRNVLDRLFCKVILDHLVVDDGLVLEPMEVKSKINEIMVGWIRKWVVSTVDDAFSGIMHKIGLGKLFSVVGGLPDGKAAGLSGILNELWKHGGNAVLSCLLELLNTCLVVGDGVLTNTQPIALIETARKILFKVLSDRISSVCNKFGVLCGDNFFVLKGMSTQSPVFAVSSVVEDALEKN
ncbi:hypothetical protein G9A89_016269 [Geosiphon pyriformis]|nr:hypothetical protein G9A89_016269 [Geosiphon pyriformis]